MWQENNRQKQISRLYTEIAENLNITKTQFDKATTSYDAVGKYLSEKLDEDVDIFPQGSMALGTVVRPSDEGEDYDVDLVCRLNEGAAYSSERIKQSVGNALKDHEVYRKKILEKGEGKRCWTIEYDSYHMDILPCVPVSATDLKDTTIRLTHKNHSTRLYEPRMSNPEAYRKWFLQNVEKLPGGRVFAYDSREFGELVKMPMYKLKRPLQQAIQLLKRHRNIAFSKAGNEDDAPISIIITTLAAKAYDGEADLFSLIDGVLLRLPRLVETKGGKFWVQNPVMPEENFAEKWDNKKYQAFVRWCVKARDDLAVKPLPMKLPDLVKWLEECLGEKPTRDAYEEILVKHREARKGGQLVVNGCRGGLGIVLSRSTSSSITCVREHTFFGE